MTKENEILTSTVIMPRELTDCDTAGLKGCFNAEIDVECGVCEGTGFKGQDMECEECDGVGEYAMKVPINWTTIKAIYAAAVNHLGN